MLLFPYWKLHPPQYSIEGKEVQVLSGRFFQKAYKRYVSMNDYIKEEKHQFYQKKNIYLDYQATTPLDRRVLEAMLPYMTEKYGNPHSSEHSVGWAAEKAVEWAKSQIAIYINSLEDEIILTSGATESNNLAIIGLGYAALKKSKRRTILVSAIEHKCVLGASRFLEFFGFKIEKIPVENDGLILIEKFKSMLSDDTLLVSVMATNNEIGVNEPISLLGKMCKNNGTIFHVDASQGAYTNIDVIENNIDLMSISAHKIYGPKGIGGLFISQHSSIKPLPIIYGGGQQNGYRSGTIPVFLGVGFGEACSIMIKEKKEEIGKLISLSTKLYEGLKEICPLVKLNGCHENRHPGNLNITLPDMEAKQLITSLQPNIAFSTGSACTSNNIEPSHVLRAIGLSTEEADRSFRLSVGRFTTKDEIDTAISLISDRLSN
jgi:cysteine desulfurase